MSQRSIEQLAIELIELHKIRPERSYSKDPEIWRVTNDKYRDHMHREYLLEQEIYGRIGIENGNERIKQMREILNLLT